MERKHKLLFVGGKKCTNHTLLLEQVLYEKASLKCKRWVYFICCG